MVRMTSLSVIDEERCYWIYHYIYQIMNVCWVKEENSNNEQNKSWNIIETSKWSLWPSLSSIKYSLWRDRIWFPVSPTGVVEKKAEWEEMSVIMGKELNTICGGIDYEIYHYIYWLKNEENEDWA